MNFEKICVLGLGYIGLPTASMFATHGLQVIGVDVNRRVVETLQNGGLHIHEPGLRTLVRAALSSGNLTIQSEPQPADAFIIAVPTPFTSEKRADLSYVISAARSILRMLRRGNLVVLESTSPPRTTLDVLVPLLAETGLRAGEDYHLVYSPERVLPGQILRELVENARVVGGVDLASAQAGQQLYATFVRGEIVLTDATTAEMVKLMENTYRDVNIAIANEFSRLGQRFGVDTWQAIEIANRHPRVDILRPGPGVGGHCISVDPWFLVEAAPDLTPLIRTARQVNDAQPDFVIDLVCQLLGAKDRRELDGRRIAILGLSYKPDVDDLRESPAVEVARHLAELGVQVSAYEPYKLAADLPGIRVVPTLAEALAEAELAALLVAHKPLVELRPAEVAELTPTRLLLDAVHGWRSLEWKEAGFRLVCLGSSIR